MILLNLTNTLSIVKEFVVMFYDAKKKKVIWIGSSQVGNHSILANIHVEEIAIDKIKKHIKQNNLNYKYVKNFK